MSVRQSHLKQLSLTGFLGGLLGTLLAHWLRQTSQPNAATILNRVKRQFAAETPVAGSWIQSHPFPFQKFAVKTTVYAGGISRYEDGQLVTYEFLADAATGSIVNVERLPVVR